jgi:hypothetical protein
MYVGLFLVIKVAILSTWVLIEQFILKKSGHTVRSTAWIMRPEA